MTVQPQARLCAAPRALALAQRCRLARERLRLSPDRLAARAGVAVSVIRNVESGRNATIRNLIGVAGALQVEPHWLATGDGPMEMQDSGMAQRWLAIWESADEVHRGLIESAFAVAESSAAVPLKRQA